MMLTYAFCTYNRADRLQSLVAAMRAQTCPVRFEILAVNNNSADNTLSTLENLALQPGAPLRIVTETAQGIVYARNRAIEESLNSDILVFIDDDEIPETGLLEAAHHAVANEGARCVGGRIRVDFKSHGRPRWLDREIAGFLGELDYGSESFWIESEATPVWSGNIAYHTSIFREIPDLRFDRRYNREGMAIGGGEDVIMFRRLLTLGIPMRYRPDMVLLHNVEPWRLRRRYFLRLHYQAGRRKGLHELPDFARKLLGVPPFLVSHALTQSAKALASGLLHRPGALRQAMNASHAIGLISGFRQRHRLSRKVVTTGNG